jgi:hypothetical protein
MIARSLRHAELVVLLYLDIACYFILRKMEADNFIYVHQGIIQLISAMYLSLILKRFFIHVPHKVVDTLVVVNEEEILKLSLPIYRDDDFFFDNEFT